MYYYIVDPQKITQKEFERVQNVLYSSLSEYRIAGEVVRVTGVRSVNQLVENAFAHEAKTIVAVGNDETLTEVINAVRGREIVVGFIPLGSSEIGKILGIPDLTAGAKTIGLRRIEAIDLGSVNNSYFLSKLSFGDSKQENFEIKFAADAEFTGSQTIAAGMIVNSRYDDAASDVSKPNDGMLDVFLLPQLSFWNQLKYRREIKLGHLETIPQTSVLHLKKIEITQPEGLSLKSGGTILAKTPATIQIIPKALKIIVGKSRNF